MNKKQQLLTSLISEINKSQPKKETIIRGLSELEKETKKDCSHCQHKKYAEQISAFKASKWEQKTKFSTKNP
jgi:UDP-3-O-[3-hydroxymyristoyl] glucosamine N-acyltransferase